MNLCIQGAELEPVQAIFIVGQGTRCLATPCRVITGQVASVSGVRFVKSMLDALSGLSRGVSAIGKKHESDHHSSKGPTHLNHLN